MSRNALIVGINNYEFAQPLKSCARNAEAIARMLEQHSDFSVRRLPAIRNKAENTFRIWETQSVKLDELEQALVELFKPAGTSIPDAALFFFSGHGLRRDLGIQEGYLAASEASLKHGNRGLSLQWFRRLLLDSPIRTQIIWLDCCHSGEMLQFDEADPADRGRRRDRLFIAASREYQLAYEEPAGQYGFLTHALLNALNPANHPSGIVDNDTLVAHLRSSWQTGVQTPLIHNSGERFILTRSVRPAETVIQVTQTTCPYRGLQYFDCNEEDPKYFFGRTALTDQLLEKVRESNVVAVLGPSGSGKSSVIHAGLLHQLKSGQRISGSEHWRISIFRPGQDPLENLAFAFVDPNLSGVQQAKELSDAGELIAKGVSGLESLISVHASDNRRLVLLADQFEEVFTLCKDQAKRRQFFECLLGAVSKSGKKICLIIAMRADFFGKCAEQEYAGLHDYIQQNLITVTPMNADELRQAIVQPAALSGAKAEEMLVKQIIEDVNDSPGTLPLMQYALTELWKHLQGNLLTLTEYSRMGGVKGTLAKRADDIYESFGNEQDGQKKQEIAKRIFIALTQLGEGTEDTRRQVQKDSLISLPENAETINEVIRSLTDENLIVTTEVQAKGSEKKYAVVDVAHEALIRHWPRMRTWLDINRDDIRFYRRLEEAAIYWEKNYKAEGLLWRSPDLELLEKFYQNNAHEMKPIEIEFYKDSIQARDQAKREKEERQQRELEQSQALAIEQQRRATAQKKANRSLRGLLFLLCILALFVIRYAFDQKKHAEEQKQLTEKSQNLLANNYWFSAVNIKIQGNPLASLHYFARSAKEEPNNQLTIDNSLFDIHYNIQISLSQHLSHTGSINGVKFTEDERRILTWSYDGTARLWNVEADYDFPKDCLPLLVEVATGKEMDDFGNVKALNAEDWKKKWAKYIAVAEEHLKTCQYKSANMYLNRQKPFWNSDKN